MSFNQVRNTTFAVLCGLAVSTPALAQDDLKLLLEERNIIDDSQSEDVIGQFDPYKSYELKPRPSVNEQVLALEAQNIGFQNFNNGAPNLPMLQGNAPTTVAQQPLKPISTPVVHSAPSYANVNQPLPAPQTVRVHVSAPAQTVKPTVAPPPVVVSTTEATVPTVLNGNSDKKNHFNIQDFTQPFVNAKAALIMNANTGEILYEKNINAVRSIASISKLMAAMVILDAKLDMNEPITITEDEIDRLKNTSSRLTIDTTLTRGQLLHLGLMSSENRAIHALARTYPGGMSAFINAMNQKAKSLGMHNSRFYEPTGLDPRNVSTARELSMMVRAANRYPQIRSLSTSNFGSAYTSNGKTQNFKNTNALVRNGAWNISVQKTGYIKESGRSMVLQAQLGKDPMIIVVLGSSTTSNRVNDAETLGSFVLSKQFSL